MGDEDLGSRGAGLLDPGHRNSVPKQGLVMYTVLTTRVATWQQLSVTLYVIRNGVPYAETAAVDTLVTTLPARVVTAVVARRPSTALVA